MSWSGCFPARRSRLKSPDAQQRHGACARLIRRPNIVSVPLFASSARNTPQPHQTTIGNLTFDPAKRLQPRSTPLNPRIYPQSPHCPHEQRRYTTTIPHRRTPSPLFRPAQSLILGNLPTPLLRPRAFPLTRSRSL